MTVQLIIVNQEPVIERKFVAHSDYLFYLTGLAILSTNKTKQRGGNKTSVGVIPGVGKTKKKQLPESGSFVLSTAVISRLLETHQKSITVFYGMRVEMLQNRDRFCNYCKNSSNISIAIFVQVKEPLTETKRTRQPG